VEESSGPWQRYKTALNRFVAVLEGGLLKHSRVVKEKMLLAKHHENRAKIAGPPPVAALRAAVETRYPNLTSIKTEFGDKAEPLPRNVQGLANAIMAGAIWLDMFGGRKAEWEIMSLSEVDLMLEEGMDWLLCPEHKTSKTYGSLAKWLSRGARKAVEVYRALPRRPEVATFLVPAFAGTTKVDVRKALALFCARYLPPKSSKPNVNLMRKCFHKKLMEFTTDETSLKEVMTALDGHSMKTIARHDALKELAGDVHLAKLFVKQVLGETATFPEQGSSDMNGDQLVAPVPQATKKVSLEQADEEDEKEDDSFALEWWPMGGFFGVKQPLPALGDSSAASSLQGDAEASNIGGAAKKGEKRKKEGRQDKSANQEDGSKEHEKGTTGKEDKDNKKAKKESKEKSQRQCKC